MIRTQSRKAGQGLQRIVLRKVLIDEVYDALALPRSKPAAIDRSRCRTRPVETQELNRERTAQRVGIHPIGRVEVADQRLEFNDRVPERAVLEE